MTEGILRVGPNIPDYKCGISPTEAEGIRQEGVKPPVKPFGWYPKPGGILVRMLEIDIRCDEAVLHHQHRIYHFAGSCHPHFVSRLGLRTGHRDRSFPEDGGYRLGLVGIPDVGGSSVSVDISYLFPGQTGSSDCHLQGPPRPVHVRAGYMVTVAGEAVSKHFRIDMRSPADRAFIALQYEGGGTSARYQSVSVTVERPAGPLGLVFPHREGFPGARSGSGVPRVLWRGNRWRRPRKPSG